MDPPALPSPRLPKATLLQILAVASGVQVSWKTGKRAHLGQRAATERAWITVSASQYQDMGWDEPRKVLNPITGNEDLIVVGQRQFTLGLRASSLDATLEATDLLERVRFGFYRNAVRQLMIPTIALIGCKPIVELPDTVADNRIVLTATMDMRMQCVVSADPRDSGEGSYIESVNGGTFTGTGAGTLLP